MGRTNEKDSVDPAVGDSGASPASKLSSGELATRYDQIWTAPAHRILNRFRIPDADRADLLQEVFTSLYLRRKRVIHHEHWFMVALRNRCRRYYRDRAIAARATEVEAERLRRETHRRSLSGELEAHQILERLPPRHAALLFGRFFAGKSYDELALQFGASAASLRRSVLRILTRLRRAKKKEAAPGSRPGAAQ
jgi:RNA polymerase sigma factor (sigma-70 family)